MPFRWPRASWTILWDAGAAAPNGVVWPLRTDWVQEADEGNNSAMDQAVIVTFG